MSSAYLAGFGRYLPERIVANAELAERLGKTPEWIESSSGIRERRYAAPEETVADIGVAAARHCLETASAETIDLVLVASGSASSGFPGPAASIAQRLGLENTPALDLPIASAGSLFGLALAMRLSDAYPRILLIASEKMSALAGDDPNTAILFGDGAGAALITHEAEPGARWRLTDAVLHSAGEYAPDLAFDASTGALHMNGLNVILHAARKMPAAIEELLSRNQLTPGDVSAFLLHQANANLLTRIAKSLKVSPERFYTNIARYGNTSSASMLIAASEWSELASVSGSELASVSNVVFCAFGAGFHWGAVLGTAAVP